MLPRWKWWLSPVDCVTAMSHNDWRKERQERQKKMKGQSPSWDVVEGWKKDCVLPGVGWLKKEERSSWLLHKKRTLAYVSACGLPLLLLQFITAIDIQNLVQLIWHYVSFWRRLVLTRIQNYPASCLSEFLDSDSGSIQLRLLPKSL